MDLENIWSMQSTALGAVWVFATTGWDMPKIIATVAALFTILSTSYGLYTKWRNSGRQQIKRLVEFITAEDKRLSTSREVLGCVVSRPGLARSEQAPVFPRQLLSTSLIDLKFRKINKAPNELKSILDKAKTAEELALKSAKQQQKEQAMTCLMLGAEAASREPKNEAERVEAQTFALQYFNQAIDIDATDQDALHYAGLMLLKKSNASGALDRFNQLIAVLTTGTDKLALARAYCLQSTAYTKLTPANYVSANAAAGTGLGLFPQDAPPLEVAEAHEQRGDIRLAQGSRGVANQSYQSAFALFHGHRRIPEAADGFERVGAKIAELNRVVVTPALVGPNDGAAMQLPAPMLASITGSHNGTQLSLNGTGHQANQATAPKSSDAR
jgi:tetratricopeptide (TPR) repeat protein